MLAGLKEVGYLWMKNAIPDIGIIVIVALYDIAAFSEKESQRKPNVVLLANRRIPTARLCKPKAAPLNSWDTFQGITALCTVSEMPASNPYTTAKTCA